MAIFISTSGPLAVSSENPRYFADSSTGRIVYLTGSHTWNNFHDFGFDEDGDGIPDYIREKGRGAPGVFYYRGYLEFLVRNNHNCIRLWVWEHPLGTPWICPEPLSFFPLPYRRTGPGLARDGKPKFNLDEFEPYYFERLAERVEAARRKGIYVVVMLFCGPSIGNRGWPEGGRNPWESHPYHRDNNVNGLDGDTDGDGQGWEIRDPGNDAVLDRQKAYIRKVVGAPCNELASTAYCLAVPGREYLVFQPVNGAFAVDLRDAAGKLACEWFNPTKGRVVMGRDVPGGAARVFENPFEGPAVLYLYSEG